MGRGSFLFGLGLTVLWAALYFYISADGAFSWAAYDHLTPNEWGDWAAGLAAPIAFLWLILGYVQQGQELRSSVEALRLQEKALQLQVKELNDSVKQQTAMAQSAAKQVQVAEKAQLVATYQQVLQHQPVFGGFVPWEPRADRFTLAMQNLGATCLNVRVTLPSAGAEQRVDDHGPGFGGGQPWMHKTERRFTLYMGEQQSPCMLRFAISYQDQMGIHQTQTYRLDIPSWPPAEGHHLMATRETFAFVMPTVASLVAEERNSPH